jgi:UDP-2,3-diacylglucosamine pyrophosphatase LpxH
MLVETADLFKNHPEEQFNQSLVEYSFDGTDIYVISDLHLGSGFDANMNYTGNENFFADMSFRRFLAHTSGQRHGLPMLLVINGDLVDFLRIADIPERQADFEQWSAILGQIGIDKTLSELRDSIVKKERTFGLKTDDYKSVWKLYLCMEGHKPVFESLANWLLQGNKLIITKGNHDLEWYWKPVRDYLRLWLAESIAEKTGGSSRDALVNSVFPNLLFVDDKLIIDGKIYIEHGHRYENFTKVYGPPVLKNQTELNLPFGSFFNRYLINRVELAYPYVDNVRPSENILSVLIQERFPLAIKILFYYVPFTLLIIPKRQYKYALRYLFRFLLLIVLPIAVTVAAFLIFNKVTWPSTPTGIVATILKTLENLAFLILSYFLGRLFSMLQLSSPASLFKNAQAALEKHPGVEVATFGHTHDPEQKDDGRKTKRYYNTGTWIPVFETDAADIRPDKTYTFLRLLRDGNKAIADTCLMRWNDDAGRVDEMILMDRK